MINREFGLIGFPLSHSFSRNYFEEKFTREGIADAAYHLFEMEDISEIRALVSRNPLLDGLNITIPFKEMVIPFLDELDAEVKEIGAVNCIKVSRFLGQASLKGYNTDMPAFREMIRPYIGNYASRALVLGTGGASRAVCAALRKDGINCQTVTRKDRQGGLTYTDMAELDLKEVGIIVNATPAGMFPNSEDCPGIPFEKIGKDHLLVDLVYNPALTVFLKKGMERGSTTINGLKMLHLQAEMSWKIWSD